MKINILVILAMLLFILSIKADRVLTENKSLKQMNSELLQSNVEDQKAMQSAIDEIKKQNLIIANLKRKLETCE